MRFPNPLKPLTSRAGAALWAFSGRRRLQRGDVQGALRSFREALRRRPGGFRQLMDVAQAHLCARELREARRYLAHAREANPLRYDMQAAATLARCGFDLDSVFRAPPPQPRRADAVAAPLPRAAGAAGSTLLPFGDCQDLDEYARFRAMPPISRAEVEDIDWDAMLGDLLDE